MFIYESGVIVILPNKRKDIEIEKNKKRKNKFVALCGNLSITGKNLSKLRIDNSFWEKDKHQVRAIYSSFRPKESTT